MKNKEIIEKVFDTYNKPNFRMKFDMASDMLIDLLNKALELKEKDILKLIKAWDGYGDDRFPEGELKELVREIKKQRLK